MSVNPLRETPAQGVFLVGLAASPAHQAAAHGLRHQVFCVEQQLFENDRDAIDAFATTIVACTDANEVIGTVRIHEREPHLWFGSRLAVAAGWRRRAGLGAALIRAAVGTAHARGCRRFLAHVQAQNVRLFESLHWRSLETFTLHGAPHCLMQADLAQYPPTLSPDLMIPSAAA